MPSISLSGLVGGGGGLVLTTILTPQSVAAGATGDIITITPPAGKRAVLLGLWSQLTTTETNITVSVAASSVITGTLAGTGTSAGGALLYKIGTAAATGNATSFGGPTVDMIVAPLADQVITVNKSGGNTANQITYIAAYGD